MFSSKKYIVLPILYMVFIFILSYVPVTDGKIAGYISAKPTIQNLLHIPLFGLLAFLWMKSFHNYNLQFKKVLIYSLIITIGYSLFDELHQYFIPGRYASFVDFLFNAVGYLAGMFFYSKTTNQKPLTENNKSWHF